MAKGAKARAAARRQRDKWKSKRWYSIRAPRNPWSFRVIGETLAEEPDMLVGRNYEIMPVSYTHLTLPTRFSV